MYKIQVTYYRPAAKVTDIRIFKDSNEFIDWLKRQLDLEPNTKIIDFEFIEALLGL